jgi:hypothetical protein
MAKTPGLNLVTGIDPVSAVPVDANYGPYASLAAAKSAIPQELRYDGMTVQITGAGNYWWLAADLSDAGLISKFDSNENIDGGSASSSYGSDVIDGGSAS